MYNNKLLDLVMAPHSDGKAPCFNMDFTATVIPSVSDDMVYSDAVNTVFDFLSTTKLDDSFVEEYAEHINVSAFLNTGKISERAMKALAPAISSTIIHQLLHSDTTMMDVLNEIELEGNLTPVFKSLLDDMTRIESALVVNEDDIVIGHHRVTLAEYNEKIKTAITFYAHIYIGKIDAEFVLDVMGDMFVPMQAYLLTDYVTIDIVKDCGSVLDESYEIHSIVETYREEDEERNYLTVKKEEELLAYCAELLGRELKNLHKLENK